jgi:hypothetical protein
VADQSRSTNPDTIGTIQFPVKFTTVAILCLLALACAYWYATNSLRETILFLAAGTAALGSIATAFYTARTLQLSIEKHGQDRDIERKREDRDDRREERAAAAEARAAKQFSLRYGERWNHHGLDGREGAGVEPTGVAGGGLGALDLAWSSSAGCHCGVAPGLK